MSNLTLYIGNKNYSSWSLRGWLALKHVQVKFSEVKRALFTENYSNEISIVSPSGKVPCLHDGDFIIWDSLSIIEYLYEKFPQSLLYPHDPLLRSIARSCIAEMHSGFLDLRSECPMNLKRINPKNISLKSIQDLNRIYAIWDYCKKISNKGKFLLGDFCAIDIFFAPIVSRIITYKLDQRHHQEYINNVYHYENFQTWLAEALQEKEIIEKYE